MSMIVQVAAVAIGGAIGSLARWSVGMALAGTGGGSGGGKGAGWGAGIWAFNPGTGGAEAMSRVTFPLATLVVNVVGCFAIGAVMQVIASRPEGSIDPALRAGLIAGVLGGLTTFSAFGYEGFALLRDGRVLMAAGVIGSNVVLGIGAVALGWWVARVLL